MKKYEEKKFSLPKMTGLSEKQITEHLKLYSGYVKNVNALSEKISELGHDKEKNNLTISELRRRYAFEWNGMRLHEYYFDALGGDGKTAGNIILELGDEFGSFDNWLQSFKKVGLMRGVGWALLAKDHDNGRFFNIWVSDHEAGHLAGVNILIAMDVWEHAYLLDYPPSERGKYIDTFFENLNWGKIEKRNSS